jgi:hypothetical protein
MNNNKATLLEQALETIRNRHATAALVDDVRQRRLARHLEQIHAAVAACSTHLARREPLRVRPAHEEAVVLDIDGTAINDQDVQFLLHHDDNRPHMRVWHPAWPPVLALYQHACAAGYRVVFLTARFESHRAQTEWQLRQAGYDRGWDALIMFGGAADARTVEALEQWKDDERRRLKEERGLHLVACVGDQPMDVCGAHVGEHQARLPQLWL